MSWKHDGGVRIDKFSKESGGGIAGKIAFVIFLVILGAIVFS